MPPGEAEHGELEAVVRARVRRGDLPRHLLRSGHVSAPRPPAHDAGESLAANPLVTISKRQSVLTAIPQESASELNDAQVIA